jgi:hypothetical protein
MPSEAPRSECRSVQLRNAHTVALEMSPMNRAVLFRRPCSDVITGQHQLRLNLPSNRYLLKKFPNRAECLLGMFGSAAR